MRKPSGSSRAGDKLGESFRLSSMADIQRERGDLRASLSLNLESLAITIELGTKNLSATQHINCGRLCLSLGDPQEALEHFRAAARFSRETEYTRDEGYSLIGVGVSLEQIGDPVGAADVYPRTISCLRRSLRLRRKIGDKKGEVGVLYDLARVYEDLGDTDLARKAREEAASKEGTSEWGALPIVERRN